MRTRSAKKRNTVEDPILYSLPALQKVRKQLRKLLIVDLGIEHQLLDLPEMERLRFSLLEMIERHFPSTTFLEDGWYLDEEYAHLHTTREDAVKSILNTYAGTRMVPAVLGTLCIELAGWWEELAAGVSRPAWNGRDPVWTAMYVHDLQRIGRRLFELEIRSYAGATAGKRFVVIMPGGQIQQLIRAAGYPVYGQYADEDVGGLWVTCRLTSKDGQLRMQSVCSSSSQDKANKQLAAARKGPCAGPFSPAHGKPCQMCPIPRKQCSLARSDKGYPIVGTCKNGHPGYLRREGDICLRCSMT